MWSRFLLLLIFVLFSSNVFADLCGSLKNHYGPFDYRDARVRTEKLRRVESAHFKQVTYSMALRGASNKEYKIKFGGSKNRANKGTGLPADIDYTLRASPNHPRALYAMSEYQRIVGAPKQPYSVANYRTADCYFQRAIKFVPDDATVYMVYGIYFHKRKKYDLALEKYLKAEELEASNIELLYNLGLLFYDTGKFDKAQQYADKVYASSYPLQGLKNLLMKKK